jgi:diguanylate cyclase (GGDEF)-like protein/putative nucleotidyltransferase with HDIG domain
MSKPGNIGGGFPPRLRRYVFSVIGVGVPVAVAAVLAATDHPPTSRTVVGIATFLLLTMLAEWRPVPIDVEGKRLVSLAFVFIVSSQLLFGWEWSVVIGALGIAIPMAAEKCDLIKILFNAATYTIAASLSSLSLIVDGGGSHGYGLLAVSVVISGAIFVVANVLLVCGAMAFASGAPMREVFHEHLQQSGPIFAISVFVAAQAVILWQLSAPLVLLLSAPLFALTLYQRSAVRGRVAEEAASTDSLTGLKNRRAFEEEAEGLLAGDRDGAPVALCLVDIDRFKQVNDRHGHLTGDAILEALGASIEEAAPGSGYRLGGDEFVLLLESTDYSKIISTIESELLGRLQSVPTLPQAVTISAGVALFPNHADDLHTLRKRADMALYRSKYNGRAQVTVYGVDEQEESANGDGGFDTLTRSDDRLLMAHRLVHLVDAVADASARARGLLTPEQYTDVLDGWGSFNSNHSRSVSTLAVSLARRLGVAGEELEQLQVAALLHDVGKIALPERILSKPGPLTEQERCLIERHPIIGFELLRDLGSTPAATMVLHHHERWDGAGYPAGLLESQIPFGSRIILVADAFDALTSDRAYRRAAPVAAALAEIQGESGRQFDPLVVAALHDHFAVPDTAGALEPSQQAPAWSLSTSFS